jgi:hypothetical protein
LGRWRLKWSTWNVSKFAQEAWIIVLLIPLLVAVFLQIRTHYREVAEQLSLNRSIIGPLLDFLDEMDAQQDDGQLAVVVLPEFVPVNGGRACCTTRRPG